MVRARLLGFSREREIRIAAFLARRGVYAEPCDPMEEAGGGEPQATFLDGAARSVLWGLMEGWEDAPPGHPVAAIFPVEGFPQFDTGLFPRWVDCVALPRLGEYVAQTLGAVGEAPAQCVPAVAGFLGEGGRAGIAWVRVLGPSGAVLDLPGSVAPKARLTVLLRFRESAPLTVPGQVVPPRRPVPGGTRCAVTFGGASGYRRRALARLLALRGER
ncbi:MAG: hypothetical protein Kow0092_10550 [Deferrisomatales bacterium]